MTATHVFRNGLKSGRMVVAPHASEDKKLVIKFMTDDHAQHNRTMNLNAHFAWVVGFWGLAI